MSGKKTKNMRQSTDGSKDFARVKKRLGVWHLEWGQF